MLSFRISLVAATFVTALALGQQSAEVASSVSEPAAAEKPNPTAPEAPPAVSPETAIATIRRQANEAAQLADATRAEIIDLCDKAVEKYKEAGQLSAATVLLQKEIDEAAVAQENLQTKSSKVDLDSVPTAGLSADELRTRLSGTDPFPISVPVSLRESVRV